MILKKRNRTQAKLAGTQDALAGALAAQAGTQADGLQGRRQAAGAQAELAGKSPSPLQAKPAPLRALLSPLRLARPCGNAAPLRQRFSAAPLRALLLPLLAVLCTACAWMHEDFALTSDYDYDPVIKMHSRAEGSTGENARLTFWNESSYNNLSEEDLNPSTEPLFEITMGDKVDVFSFDDANKKGTPYNTYREWPDESSTIYVSGVGPEEAINGGTLDEIEIVADARDGSQDLIASINDGTSRGSFDHPFVLPNEHTANTHNPAYNEERELKFHHLLAAIKFKARKNPDMTERIVVDSITIEINNDKDQVTYTSNGNPVTVSKVATPASLKRYVGSDDQKATLHEYDNNNANPSTVTHDKKPWTYVVDPATVEVPNRLSAYYPGEIQYDLFEGAPAQEIATFYGISPDIKYDYVPDPQNNTSGKFDPFNPIVGIGENKPVLSINISATYRLFGKKSEKRVVKWSEVVIDNWTIADGADPTGDKFMPAHMYEVTLTFNSQSVGMQAELVPWVEEGPYYYPVLGSSEHKFTLEVFDSTNKTISPDHQYKMASPNEKLYNKVLDLSDGQVIGFMEYDDAGVLKHLTPTTISVPNGVTLTQEEKTGTQGDNTRLDPNNHNNHYIYSGDNIEYLIMANKIDHKLTLIPTTSAEGFYINDQKLDNTYNGGYVTSSLVHLDAYDGQLSKLETPDYLIGYFSSTEKSMDYISPKDFNFGANNVFMHNPLSGSLQVPSGASYTNGEAAYTTNEIAGDYLLIYDHNPSSGSETNTKSIYVIRKLDTGGNPNTGNVFLNDQKMTQDGNNNIYTLTTTSIPANGLVAITIFDNDGNPVVYTFTDGTPGDDQLRVDNCNNCTLSNNTLRIKTEGEYVFTVNLNANIISCNYVQTDPDKKNSIWIDGQKREGTYTTYKYLSSTATTLEITQYDNNGHAIIVDFSNNSSGWTFNGNGLASASGSSITASTAGWYQIDVNTTVHSVTVVKEVANSKGDAILATPQYYNGDTPVSSPLTVTLTIEQDNGTATYDLGGFKYTDNRWDQNKQTIYTDVDFSGASITAPSGCTAQISGSRSTFVLSLTGPAGKYNISINLATTNPTITISEYIPSISVQKTFTTEWADSNRATLEPDPYSIFSEVVENTILKFQFTNLDYSDGKKPYIQIYTRNGDAWIKLHDTEYTDSSVSSLELDITITGNNVNYIKNTGVIIQGVNFTLDQIIFQFP